MRTAIGLMISAVCAATGLASNRSVESLSGVVVSTRAEAIQNGFHVISAGRAGRQSFAVVDPRNLLLGNQGRLVSLQVRATGQVTFNQLPLYSLDSIGGTPNLGADRTRFASRSAHLGKHAGSIWGSLKPTPTRTLVVPMDSDGDGMSDSYESAHGLQIGVNDARLDLDGDGTTNGNEAVAGTDPSNPNSVFRTEFLPNPSVGGLRLIWQGRLGRRYQVLTTGSLTAGWTPFGEPISANGDSMMSVLLPQQTGNVFYRIEVTAP